MLIFLYNIYSDKDEKNIIQNILEIKQLFHFLLTKFYKLFLLKIFFANVKLFPVSYLILAETIKLFPM